jgi:hypothetical protein
MTSLVIRKLWMPVVMAGLPAPDAYGQIVSLLNITSVDVQNQSQVKDGHEHRQQHWQSD